MSTTLPPPRSHNRAPARPVTSDSQLGTIKTVADWLGLPRSTLYDFHRIAKLRETEAKERRIFNKEAPENPNFVRGRVTSGDWVREWLLRNPDCRG